MRNREQARPERRLQTALDHAVAGRNDRSEVVLRSLLAGDPAHVEALRLLGRLRLGASRPAEAMALLTRAARLAPGHPVLAHEAGVAALACGQAQEAVGWFSRQLAAHPDSDDSRFNLAWALRSLDRTGEAVETYRTLVRRQPGHGAAWYNLANGLLALQRFADASAAYRQALARLGPKPDVTANAVLALLRQGRIDEARAVLEACPAEARTLALRSVEGELLLAEQRLPEALACFKQLQALNPGHRPSLVGMVRSLSQLNRTGEAFALIDRSARGQPEDPELSLIRAEAALAGDDLEVAAEAARFAADRLGTAESFAMLGKALALSGRTREALAAFRAGLARHPDCHALHSNLLFCLLHDAEATPEQVFEEHRAFGRRWESRYPVPAFEPQEDGPVERPLRVGYVSPDFCDHAVAFFVEPLLAGHDPAAVEVFCYHIPRKTDRVTARLRAQARWWRELAFGDIDGAIAMIRRDRIDILVDIAGHTAWNMLPVFAARPAPVQVSCIGYPGTTGLTRIDYRLVCGAGAKDSDLPRFSTETLESLPLTFVAPPRLPEVTPPPFLGRGRITFGSVSKLVKVGEPVRRLWGRLLERLPEARLLLVAPGVDRPEGAAELRQRLAAAGLPADRVDLRPECGFDDWLGYLGEIDIVLDPFPYTAGSTATLLQWMGLPTVRLGPESHPELGIYAADSEDAYLAAALALAGDRPRLFGLRGRLRANALVVQHSRNAAIIPALELFYRRAWLRFRHLDLE